MPTFAQRFWKGDPNRLGERGTTDEAAHLGTVARARPGQQPLRLRAVGCDVQAVAWRRCVVSYVTPIMEALSGEGVILDFKDDGRPNPRHPGQGRRTLTRREAHDLGVPGRFVGLTLARRDEGAGELLGARTVRLIAAVPSVPLGHFQHIGRG